MSTAAAGLKPEPASRKGRPRGHYVMFRTTQCEWPGCIVHTSKGRCRRHRSTTKQRKRLRHATQMQEA